MQTIAIFSGYYLPHLGGVERYTYNLAKKLKNMGYKIIIVTSRYDENLKEIEDTEYAKIFRLPTYKIVSSRYPINKQNKTNPPEMKTELCEIKSGVLENDKVITKVLDKDEEYSYNISDLYGLIKYKYFKLINKNEYLSKISAKNLRKIIK